MTDPVTFLLPLAGGGLQFLRQFQNMPKWVFPVAVVVVSCAVYWLAVPEWWRGDWRMTTLDFLAWAYVNVSALLGGTFLVSKGASKAVSVNPDLKGHPLVPVTKSM